MYTNVHSYRTYRKERKGHRNNNIPGVQIKLSIMIAKNEFSTAKTDPSSVEIATCASPATAAEDSTLILQLPSPLLTLHISQKESLQDPDSLLTLETYVSLSPNWWHPFSNKLSSYNLCRLHSFSNKQPADECIASVRFARLIDCLGSNILETIARPATAFARSWIRTSAAQMNVWQSTCPSNILRGRNQGRKVCPFRRRNVCTLCLEGMWFVRGLHLYSSVTRLLLLVQASQYQSHHRLSQCMLHIPVSLLLYSNRIGDQRLK